MILNGTEIPPNLERYSTPPEYLQFRYTFTEKELEVLNKKYKNNIIITAVISGVIILCAYFAANYFFGLSKNNADGSVNDFFYLLGIVIIITSIVGAVIAIARAAKKEFGICSNGILLDAFDTRYHANGSKRGQHAFCLSAWFPETNQYCRRIKCGDLRSWTYGSYEKGDEVTVYKINKYEVFGLCSPRRYPMRYM